VTPTSLENYTLAVGLSLFISDQFANRWDLCRRGADRGCP
jgi:hypothetical protein